MKITRSTYRSSPAARRKPAAPPPWVPPRAARASFVAPSILPADCAAEETP